MSSRARALRARLTPAGAALETTRGGVIVFAAGLAVYWLQSVALPVVGGRDFGTYLDFYVQMWDWHAVTPMSMLFRTPVTPLVVGGVLDVAGGWGAQILMSLLFAGSVLAWTRVAGAFGGLAALATAAVLLLYPGYGLLFHMLASDSICAAAFAAFALALTRAWIRPSPGRFALVGAAVTVAALTRPGYQVLVLTALAPLVLPLGWGPRLRSALACALVVAGALGAWTLNNGLRYDDYTVARGSGAFFPFYRAFTSDHIVAPENGDASLELARLVRRRLLPEEPYRSYGVTLNEFFSRGSPRMWEDTVWLSDRFRGWDSDYALLREAGIEAVRAQPLRYARGVTATVLEELWDPLQFRLSPAPEEARPVRTLASAQQEVPLPRPSDGEPIPGARQGFFTATPDGSIREVWTSATEHSLVFADPEDEARYAEAAADAAALGAELPPYPGNDGLTQRWSQLSRAYPPPLVWLLVGAVALAVRRPARSGLAIALAAAALVVVTFQALAVYTIIQFAVPVAPAFVLLAAAGLLGRRARARS